AVEHLKFAGANRVVTEIEESLRRTAREGPLPRSAVTEEPTPIRPGAIEKRPASADTAPTAAPEPTLSAAPDLPPFQVPDDLLSETASGPVASPRMTEPPPLSSPASLAPAAVMESPVAAAAPPAGAAAVSESTEKIRVTSTVVSSPVESM